MSVKGLNREKNLLRILGTALEPNMIVMNIIKDEDQKKSKQKHTFADTPPLGAQRLQFSMAVTGDIEHEKRRKES